jgi:hypothetical protein
MPVYIPHLNGYYQKSFEVFQLCINSLLKTSHSKTHITIVNNGSCSEVVNYLNSLINQRLIHEVVHTTNIGKVNAIIKGLVGHPIELVTITDADVLFLPHWQEETVHVFEKIPQAGAVGLVPQFGSFKNKAENVVWSNLFNAEIRFLPVSDPEAMVQFYDSIGWERDYNPDYLKYTLGIEKADGFKAIIGAGHVVTTYKRSVFDEIIAFMPFKLGGPSEGYLDALPLKKDYWRLTTYNNYAYHMGNMPEQWMTDVINQMRQHEVAECRQDFFKANSHKSLTKYYLIRNKLFNRLFKLNLFRHFLYSKWGLPKASIKKY